MWINQYNLLSRNTPRSCRQSTTQNPLLFVTDKQTRGLTEHFAENQRRHISQILCHR